jgi:hypothetical protein
VTLRTNQKRCRNFDRKIAAGNKAVGVILSAMTLKTAAFFAMIGMALLTLLVAVGFIRDVSILLAGAIAALAVLKSLIYLVAGLGLTVFRYVFYKAQS